MHRWAAKNGLDHSIFKDTLPPLAAAVRHSVHAARDALAQQMAAASRGQSPPPDTHLAALYGCEEALPPTMTLPSITAAFEVLACMVDALLTTATGAARPAACRRCRVCAEGACPQRTAFAAAVQENRTCAAVVRRALSRAYQHALARVVNGQQPCYRFQNSLSPTAPPPSWALASCARPAPPPAFR